MADQTPITPFSANKVPHASEYAVYFSAQFLPLIADYIGAEYDLEDVEGGYDPAYCLWEVEADLARERVNESLAHLATVELKMPTDKVLRRMTVLIKALVETESAKDFKQLHRNMQRSFFKLFQVRGFGKDAFWVNAYLVHARHLVDALVALPIFERWSDEELDVFNSSSPDDSATYGL